MVVHSVCVLAHSRWLLGADGTTARVDGVTVLMIVGPSLVLLLNLMSDQGVFITMRSDVASNSSRQSEAD